METVPDDHKRCTRCGAVKPRTEFSPRTAGRDGHTSQCKACACAAAKAKRAANPELARAKAREWYWNNREKAIALVRAWQKRNPELTREINRRAVRSWVAKNRERHNANGRAWRARNPEKAKAFVYAWRARNPERQKAIDKRYKKRHPAKCRHWEKRRRAQRRNAEGMHTLSEWTAKLRAYKGRCHWCRRKIKGRPHRDHLIPLAVGGRDDIANVVPSCERCNCSKGAKLPHEFMGRLL